MKHSVVVRLPRSESTGSTFVDEFPHELDASGVESFPSQTDRNIDIEKIRQVLEMKLVGERLGQLGFTQEDIQTRLNRLDDRQLHKFALQLDDLKVGGDGGAGVAIVVLLILVIFLMIVMLGRYGGRGYRRYKTCFADGETCLTCMSPCLFILCE